MDWTPGNHTQAEDRIHRIGQTKKTMHYYMIALDTIEEHLCRLIRKKQKILDAVLDGKETKEFAVFTKILNYYRNKK